MRTRKFLSTLIPALPMLLTAIFLAAMRSKAHAQFGGVEQPMFQLASASTFSPDEFGTLLIWHKPETLSGTNGASINNWTNIQGVSYAQNHLIPGPYLTNSVINEYAALTDAGGSSFLSYSNGLNTFSSITGCVAFVVMRTNTFAEAAFAFYARAGATFARFGIYRPSANAMQILGETGHDGSTANSDTWTPSSGWWILTVDARYATGDVFVYENGVQKVADTTWVTDGTTTAVASNDMYILGTASGTPRCTVAEFILYTRTLTTEERETVMDYLASKYGL